MRESGSVLVVDDEEIVPCSVAAGLKGFRRVACAADGATALRMLTETAFDHMVLDCVLPDLTPLEVVTRAKLERPGLDVVMISGLETPGLLAQAFRAGARAFLPKPFGPAALEAALRSPERRSPASVDDAASMLLAEGYPLDRAVAFMRLELLDRARRPSIPGGLA